MNEFVFLIKKAIQKPKTNIHTMLKETTFYQELQNLEGLDLRDNRGKRHNLAFVLLGLVISLLRCRDGKLSSIHRSMQNTNKALCNALNIDIKPVISRSHLPRILQKVNLKVYESLIFKHYGLQLSKTEKKWFAGDGKELRAEVTHWDSYPVKDSILYRHF